MAEIDPTYRIKKTEDNIEYEHYTLFGDHDYLDDNNNPRSKKDSDKVIAQRAGYPDGRIKHFLKIGPHGKLYNPIGLYSEGNANKFVAKFGKKTWEYKQVSQRVFELYTNFLRTKNIAWLNNAEREME
jgi:hypothetical protein